VGTLGASSRRWHCAVIGLSAGASEIAVFGAHCDDIAIGMGGTLLALSESIVGLRVRALVLSGGGTPRETEERDALTAFCPGADVDVDVVQVPDGFAPANWSMIKTRLHETLASCDPDVVFGPQQGDAHQDHRVVAELLPTVFRDHLVLGYEIPKWECDTPQPTTFIPIRDGIAEEKARLLLKYYPSQTHHDWFDEQVFLGLMRLRGAQCRSRFAEAFICNKALLTFDRSERL
jgi:LmbE family N-acetylglucosaminyl deacetylase